MDGLTFLMGIWGLLLVAAPFVVVWLLARVSDLRHRVQQLESTVSEQQHRMRALETRLRQGAAHTQERQAVPTAATRTAASTIAERHGQTQQAATVASATPATPATTPAAVLSETAAEPVPAPIAEPIPAPIAEPAPKPVPDSTAPDPLWDDRFEPETFDDSDLLDFVDSQDKAPQQSDRKTAPVAFTNAAPAAAPPASSRPIAQARAQQATRPATPATPAFDPLTWAKNWLLTGNLPVKVGMLVLFAGVAALLRYASEQGWVEFPLWARLLAVALAAAGALGFGWRQRTQRPSFALTLQGGALGIELLTVFAAYRMYGLLPQSVAFVLTIALLALIVWLALKQNAQTLALFGVLGGFLAPLWLGGAQASLFGLFAYYAVLNAAIFAIAIRNTWRPLYLVGFVFTFGLTGLWTATRYAPHLYPAAQTFLLCFLAMYVALPPLARRLEHRAAAPREQKRLALVGMPWQDALLVFGTPLMGVMLQSALNGSRSAMGYFAIAAALLYGALAWVLRRDAVLKEFIQAWSALAIAFATLAVPLLLSAQTTSASYAVLASALIWLSLRQERLLLQWMGMALHALAALALLPANVRLAASLDGTLIGVPAITPFAHSLFYSGVLLVTSAFVSAWLLAMRGQKAVQQSLAGALLGWGLLGTLWLLHTEIARLQPGALREALPLLSYSALALLAWAAQHLLQQRTQQHSGAATLAAVALALAVGLPLLHWLQEPMRWYPGHSGWMALAVGIYLLCSRALLHRLRGAMGRFADGHAIANAAWWLHLAWMLSTWAARWLSQTWGLQGTDLLQKWSLLPLAAPVFGLAALCLYAPQWLGFGAGQPWSKPQKHTAGRQAATPTPPAAQTLLGWLALLGVALAALPSLMLPGQNTPLPWLPLINPPDLVLAAALALGLRAWQNSQIGSALAPELAQRHAGLLCVAAIVWLSKSALAALHHWAGLPWDLLAMMQSALAQATVTLLWGALAVLAWIIGSRRRNRALWQLGLIIMGVVLCKLVLIDRQHLGNLWGIVSFIGYGLLCVLIGYIAPAPPRTVKRKGDD